MSTQPFPSALPSRRALVGAAPAAAALSRLGPLSASAQQDASGDPVTWRTWLLTSADELRPAAPPAPTVAEVDELLDLLAKRTDETAELVTRWGTGPTVLPWADLGLDLADEFGLSGPRDARAQALLRAAMYDAVLAADRPSFPSEHAAVAGAAATVLADLFPDAETGRFDEPAEEAAESRLWTGASYRSDVEAGLSLGRAVGDRAVAREGRRLRRHLGRQRPADRPRLLGAHPAGVRRDPGRAAGRHLGAVGPAQRRRGPAGAAARLRLPALAGRAGGGPGGDREPHP